MYVGYSDQISAVDRLSVEKYGKKSISLMFGAAKAVFSVLSKQNLKNADVCILCGKGNNAGDGFALATLFENCAKSVTIVLLCGKNFSKDAQYYFDKLPKSVNILEGAFVKADVYVDAVFGTGFIGELPKDIALVFRKVNQTKALKIAVDIPSGIEADTGKYSQDTFQADKTVTFEILKFAHVLAQCRHLCGQVKVMEIGLSKEAISDMDFDIQLLERLDLPKKPDTLHKGSNGTLFSIVGSKKFQGAATLSVKSALRGGCGIVSAFVPESIYLPLACKVDSAIINACPENEHGAFSIKAIDKLPLEIKNRVPDAILVGSGMGVCDATGEIVNFVLQQKIKCVVDGDGLRYVTEELLQNRGDETILTPHIAEFSRMLGTDIPTVIGNRFVLSKEYAIKNKCVLVLKDSITVITLPSGKQWVLSSPNAALAKGGSGDVLAGLIASFLAQEFTGEQAALAGVFYHSAAGKKAAELYGEYATLPEDVILQLPYILK